MSELHDRLAFERRVSKAFAPINLGQHVYFDVPTSRGLDPIYAFAAKNKLKVLDVKRVELHVGPAYRVKAVDSPPGPEDNFFGVDRTRWPR